MKYEGKLSKPGISHQISLHKKFLCMNTTSERFDEVFHTYCQDRWECDPKTDYWVFLGPVQLTEWN